MSKPTLPFSRFLRPTSPSDSSRAEQGYLLGVRGFLVIQTFLWVFLQTFLPTAVKDSANASGPLYAKVLRDTFSVLFWNEGLLYSAFILLSARTVCIPFISNPSKVAVASAVFRRGLRLWFPVAETSPSTHQYSIPNALAYFNSVFNLFWTTAKFFEQAGNTAFPSQTLWAVNVIYAQSYTVYMTMVIIPYTRNEWRVKAYICFIITAWWVQSWAWYSITGLLLADTVMNMRFKESAQRGVRIWRTELRCPTWIPCLMLMAAGLVMQYLWTDWRPQYENKELLAHTGLYYSGGLNTIINRNEPQARDDDYLLLLGFFLLLEYSDFLQRAFQNPLFMYLGRRSLSWFLVQSIIIYSAGIKLFMHLSVQRGLTTEGANAVCLIVCLPLVVMSAEIFHRVVDQPSQGLARMVFDWIRE